MRVAHRIARVARLGAILALAAASGCTRSYTLLEPTDAGPRPDAWDRDAGFVPPAGKCLEGTPVDLLLVIDNSNSMAEEQVSLSTELPRLIGALVDPPDTDGDGELDWLPVSDLHLGVVSTDMGTGGFRVPTCAEPNFGDDGILRTEGNTAVPGCMATYPPFLTFRAGAPDPAELAADFNCVAQLGTGGCGFEQQLEAALKAVTPSTSSLPFAMGTVGHGDRENAGFLRAESLLAVVIVTDEEDCSAADPELFNPSSAIYAGDLNLRCSSYPAAVHPVSRYVDGFRALRRDRPDLLVYGVIAGVPTDLVEGTGAPDHAAILADDRMQETLDPTMPTRLTPSCNVPGRGLAFPPRRLVEIARQLPQRSVVQSICQADFRPAVERLTALVGRRACRTYEFR